MTKGGQDGACCQTGMAPAWCRRARRQRVAAAAQGRGAGARLMGHSMDSASCRPPCRQRKGASWKPGGSPPAAGKRTRPPSSSWM